jgi:hypothetical protein
MVETMLREFPNVLTLRVRMPIVADLTYARNFITKVRSSAYWLRPEPEGSLFLGPPARLP